MALTLSKHRAIAWLTLLVCAGAGTGLNCSAQNASPGTPAASEYWRAQRANQAASDYYRYARKQQQQSGNLYSQYGKYASTFQKVDSVVDKNRQHFTEYDTNDLATRISALKQRISSAVTQGFDALEFQDDMANLEAEVARKIEDSLTNIGTTEQQLSETLNRLQQLYMSHKDKMAVFDYQELENRINKLREKATREHLVSSGANNSAYTADLTDEARKIEMAIIEKSLLHKADFDTAPTPTKASAANTSVDILPTATEPPQPSLLHTGSVSSDRLVPTPVRQAPDSPAPTLAKTFEKTENRLLDLHEAKRLGTFDIDAFSKRMLQLKHSCKKMAAKTGKLSKKQEAWLRLELEKINQDILERAHISN